MHYRLLRKAAQIEVVEVSWHGRGLRRRAIAEMAMGRMYSCSISQISKDCPSSSQSLGLLTDGSGLSRLFLADDKTSVAERRAVPSHSAPTGRVFPQRARDASDPAWGA